jgi:hypothetical protein
VNDDCAGHLKASGKMCVLVAHPFSRQEAKVVTESVPKAKQHKRTTHELNEFAILAVYFCITFAAVLLPKTAVLHEPGIKFTPWGIAAVKAAVLAKLILLGNAMNVGNRYGTRPLIALGVGLLALSCLSVGARAQSSAPNPAPGVNVGDQASDASNEDASALAKKLQNPIGDLYSIPFQNNINFDTGPNKGTQDILNIQPVIPIHVNDDWNVITRTILPLVWSPSYQPAQSVPFGLAPTTFSAFLSPKNPIDGWVWGVGPITELPTITSKTLGSNVWGLGPAVVVVKLAGPIVAGVLVNNVFSLGGTPSPGGTRYSLFTVNPFFNYNFGEGWYVGTSPIITANWLTAGNNAWTLPVGAAVGRVVKIGGKVPVNFQIGAYYNALRPEFGGTWQLRTQVTLIF